MPMSWIYGAKYTGPESPLLDELREELIPQAYHTVDWKAARDTIAEDDLYTPHTKLLDLFFSVVGIYEKIHSTTLRKMYVQHSLLCRRAIGARATRVHFWSILSRDADVGV